MKIPAAILVPLLGFAASAPPQIEGLIDAARGAPSEFAADAMLRIAALDQVDKPRKIELLEQAFARISGAQVPYRRRAAFNRYGGFLNRVYGQDLDALSLRVRVIEALLPLDAKKARDLFLQIPPVNPPKLACSDFMVYDVSRFYTVLESVASKTFTDKEIAKQQPVRLLEEYAGAITSPVQVVPVARLLAGTAVNSADFQSLVTMFAGALGKISGDDRSFASAATVGRQIETLVEHCKKQNISPMPLLEGYRRYLVNHLAASRCADDDQMRGGGSSFGVAYQQNPDTEESNTVDFFNQRLRVDPLQPIQEQEATPSRLEGAAVGPASCDTAECKAVGDQFRALLFNSVGSAYQAAEKDTPEWRSKLREFEAALAAWEPASEADGPAHYREKCRYYSELAGSVATPADREAVLRALLDYATRKKLEAANRLEWFLPVNALIGRAALDAATFAHLNEELRRAADPVIALYANLEATAPRPPDRILPLL